MDRVWGLGDNNDMSWAHASEEFKPIPIRREDGVLGSLKFALRLAVDLQLLTCWRFLVPRLAGMHGAVLDVGCGEMPFRGLLPPDSVYTGLDVPQADDFGMQPHSDIVSFDGIKIPFGDESFDHVICTEVLEHAADPVALIAEMHRVLRRGGSLVVTVPFSARVHHAPYDFHRFTAYRLAQMFSGFQSADIRERGDDLAVIANKLIVLCMRLKPTSARSFWRLPIMALSAPFAILALGIAHMSLYGGWGSGNDPLGYGILAVKG